jgi:hypothetical protein
MNLTISVLYSCDLCGLVDIPVSVPARENEDVIQWMETMGVLLSNDHQKRSPHCHPKTLSQVKVPMTGTDKVGGASVN